MREENVVDEGAERGTDRSVRERNPRLPWLPSHSRLASLPWKRHADFSLSPSSALCLSSSSSWSPCPVPSGGLDRFPLVSSPFRSPCPRILSRSISPGLYTSRQLAKLLSTSGIRSYSLRSFERRARESRGKEVRERKEGSDGVRAHARYSCLSRRARTSLVRIVRLVIV